MVESFEYQPDEILSYNSFLVAMVGFRTRHPAITRIEQDDEDYTDFPGCSFDGIVLGQYEFTVSYDPGDEKEEYVECISLGIILRKNSHTVEDEILNRQTARMHHDIPGTDDLSFYSIQSQDQYTLCLGGEFVLENAHTVRDMDTLFDILVRAAPLAYGQFCIAQTMIFKPVRGRC